MQPKRPLEVYDVVLLDAKLHGKLAEFLAEFGTREEYAERIGEANN